MKGLRNYFRVNREAFLGIGVVVALVMVFAEWDDRYVRGPAREAEIQRIMGYTAEADIANGLTLEERHKAAEARYRLIHSPTYVSSEAKMRYREKQKEQRQQAEALSRQACAVGYCD